MCGTERIGKGKQRMWMKMTLMVYLLGFSIQDIRIRRISTQWLIIGTILSAGCMVWRIGYGISAPGEIAVGWIPGALVLIFAVLGKQIGRGDGWILLILSGFMEAVRLWLVFSVSLLLMAVAAGALLVFRRAGRRDTLPYLPFLTIAVILSML